MHLLLVPILYLSLQHLSLQHLSLCTGPLLIASALLFLLILSKIALIAFIETALPQSSAFLRLSPPALSPADGGIEGSKRSTLKDHESRVLHQLRFMSYASRSFSYSCEERKGLCVDAILC